MLRFHNPAIMKAYADLYAGDQHNTTNFDIFSTANSLLNFSVNSYMESKYINKDYWVTESNGKLYSYTTTYDSGATDNGTEAVAKQFRVHNKISLYGSVSFGTMSMDINPLGIGNFNISTAKIYFPISFRQQIHIYGNLTSDYQIQIMGGCNVYVEEGATFTNSANFLGYGDDVQYTDSLMIGSDKHFIGYHYPKYFIGKGARLYLKGKYTQSANGFACEAISQSANAQLDIKNASTVKLVMTENGYKDLGGAVDKGAFVFKPSTTAIERVASGAEGPLSSIKQGGNLGKYQYVSVNIDGEYYWSTSSVTKLNDILIKTDGIRTAPGQAQKFNLSVEVYPSDIMIKSYKWTITKQEDFDGVTCSNKAGKASLSSTTNIETIITLPASKCTRSWSHVEPSHNFTYTIQVTVVDQNNISLTQTIQLISTRKA